MNRVKIVKENVVIEVDMNKYEKAQNELERESESLMYDGEWLTFDDIVDEIAERFNICLLPKRRK